MINEEKKLELIRDSFFVPFEVLQFHSGYVSFNKFISKINQYIDFTIQNEYICKEFNSVKKYFEKALGKNKIKVEIEIEVLGQEIKSRLANSSEIAQIDPNLIEDVKINFTKKLIKTTFNTKKSVFTLKELFEEVTEINYTQEIFYEKEAFFEDLLKISETKHHKHLSFLSDKHSHLIMKLRFVINPFSFIFLIEGVENYYFVWETLNTEEATYIWIENKDKKKESLEKIIERINLIKTEGKITYINKGNENFKRIFHDYSEHIDGFEKWKNEIKQIIL